MTLAAQARLEVAGATVRFPGAPSPALDGVDLEVAPGEVVAVLGASGSGKSTLLRAVAGLQRLDAGVVRLDGDDQRGVPPHRRDVGLMFQDHALFPHRDVASNVAFGLRMRRVGGDEAQRQVTELLELVGLEGFGRRSVTTLSGGEQQRVALARALAPSPRLLMLDEPLGALDRALRERLVADLRELFTRLGQTVVAVTHDQTEAFALADRLVVLGEGRVLRAGTPAEVWADPRRAQVARLLGLDNVEDGRLVRPTAVVLDPAGDREAVVRRVAFRGDRVAVVLDLDPGHATGGRAGAGAGGLRGGDFGAGAAGGRGSGDDLDGAGRGTRDASDDLDGAGGGQEMRDEAARAGAGGGQETPDEASGAAAHAGAGGGAGTLTADVATAEAPRPGERVRFRIDPRGVVPLD